jgi:hypothetical protein
MNEPTILCPNCKTEIKLTESLAAPLVAAAKREAAELAARREAVVAGREEALREKERQLEQAKGAIDEQVAARLRTEKARIAEEEGRKARLALDADLKAKDQAVVELQEALRGQNEKLASAAKAQADLLRKQRELDDARREMDLTVEKKVQETVSAVRETARREADEANRLRVAEKDKLIADMQRQVEELKRKAESGSQQLQGEILELELESILRARFPRDVIEPVPKGEFGGDVLQRVLGPSGVVAGTILWESKRTKAWSDGWLPKLRQDQRAAHAEIAVLVSTTMPKSVDAFDLIDGVWVTEPRCTLPIATMLRQSLIEIAGTRLAGEGQQTKTEMVYQYLTGPHFRQRVQAIVEAFTTMQADLIKEKTAINAVWSKREKQIERVMQATVGMYGDLQGIAGKSLQEIEGLDVKLLGE